MVLSTCKFVTCTVDCQNIHCIFGQCSLLIFQENTAEPPDSIMKILTYIARHEKTALLLWSFAIASFDNLEFL